MNRCRNRKGQFSRHKYIESGMVGHFKDTKDCGYGCKIYVCKNCDDWQETHNRAYGCKLG